MSFPDLSKIPQVNLQTPNGGTLLNGRPVALHTPPTQPPSVVSFVIDWSVYNPSYTNRRLAVRVDLAATSQPNTVLDGIRSVKIDNSFSAVPIYIQFPDTLDTIVCPAFSIVVTGVYTRALNCIIYGTDFYTGRAPQTTFEFCNFDRQGYSVTVTDQVEVDGRYQDDAARVMVAGASGNIPMAIPNLLPANTMIVAAFSIIGPAGTQNFPASFSFNGAAQTVATNQTITTPSIYSGIAYNRLLAPLAAGTYNYAVTAGQAGSTSVMVILFALQGLTQFTPYQFIPITSTQLTTHGDLALPFPQPIPGMLALYAESENGSVFTGPDWNGATAMAQRHNQAASHELNVAFARAIDTNPFAVGAAGNILLGTAWI